MYDNRMFTEFISITNLQRHMKNVFYSKKPMRVVLSKNDVSGIVFSQEAAKILLESGVLDQIREELWELQDADTVKVVRESRKGEGKHSVPFGTWMKKMKI